MSRVIWLERRVGARVGVGVGVGTGRSYSYSYSYSSVWLHEDSLAKSRPPRPDGWLGGVMAGAGWIFRGWEKVFGEGGRSGASQVTVQQMHQQNRLARNEGAARYGEE